ncbi:hypothetical protein BKA70DRAFT_1252798 [Coprinopsis sp. MPI-PUGE-AT-0042]|nr:hypothetical protein BKA70DRAFT_1252798 [Coprinopsis sp. MPI-PUGE-AT-0042]
MQVCVSVSVWSTAAVADIVVFRDTHHPPTTHHIVIAVVHEACLKPAIPGTCPVMLERFRLTPARLIVTTNTMRDRHHAHLAFATKFGIQISSSDTNPPPM